MILFRYIFKWFIFNLKFTCGDKIGIFVILNMPEVLIKFYFTPGIISDARYIPVIFQVASLLAALAHPGHIVIYAPGDSFPCRRDPS
ncbi:hypothetical protein CKY02_08705 [Photorhabdus bodei]|uniref:Uncharacterized protein n=1 Tax=Photorhabdus bodei TaxID=2029681 RepID=A0A329XBN5_9GAMM|nr:hypothetical protein CKY02_08705 [Photorhabdus bodei]